MNIVMERGFDLKPLRNFPDFHKIELLGYYKSYPLKNNLVLEICKKRDMEILVLM
jgi:hypothetical protein